MACLYFGDLELDLAGLKCGVKSSKNYNTPIFKIWVAL